jgi:hypothetical protein
MCNYCGSIHEKHSYCVKCHNEVCEDCASPITSKIFKGQISKVHKPGHCWGHKYNQLLNEIQEKARIAREQSKGTPAEEITKVVDEKVQEWPANKEQVPPYIDDLINYLKIKIPFYKDNKYINDSIEEIRKEKDPDKRLQIIAKLIPIIPQSIIIDNSIKTGNINGKGIVVGSHSTAEVNDTNKLIYWKRRIK